MTGSRQDNPERSQAVLLACIAQSAGFRSVPCAAGLSTGFWVRVRPAALGRRDQDSRCLFRVGSGRSEKIEAAVRRNFFWYVRSGRYTGRPRHVPSTAAMADDQT